VQVVGGRAGTAYVGWLADNSPHGYARYLRPFSTKKGWLSGPTRISRQFGNRNEWPGDTFGISMAPAAHRHPRSGWQRVIVSWGSAVSKRPHPDSEDFAATVAFPPARLQRAGRLGADLVDRCGRAPHGSHVLQMAISGRESLRARKELPSCSPCAGRVVRPI